MHDVLTCRRQPDRSSLEVHVDRLMLFLLLFIYDTLQQCCYYKNHLISDPWPRIQTLSLVNSLVHNVDRIALYSRLKPCILAVVRALPQ